MVWFMWYPMVWFMWFALHWRLPVLTRKSVKMSADGPNIYMAVLTSAVNKLKYSQNHITKHVTRADTLLFAERPARARGRRPSCPTLYLRAGLVSRRWCFALFPTGNSLRCTTWGTQDPLSSRWEEARGTYRAWGLDSIVCSPVFAVLAAIANIVGKKSHW